MPSHFQKLSMANAAVFDLDEDLAVLQGRQVDVVDDEAVWFRKDGGLGTHR